MIWALPTIAAPNAWAPKIPEGYTPITWAQAPGIITYFKAPNGNGSLDFLTRIYIPQNYIGFIASTSAVADWGPAQPLSLSNPAPTIELAPDFGTLTDTFSESGITETNTDPNIASEHFRNYAFTRFVAETAKKTDSNVRFIWNGPFFNLTVSTTDLSLALKSTIGTTTLMTSGSRPPADSARARQLLIINNQTGRATITPFSPTLFTSSTIGDQALEGFAAYNIGSSMATERLFIGISTSSTELVIYCSRQATADEARLALTRAGVPVELQLEADGGGSATCGYNLPGQFFVEPERTLPLLMGATTLIARGSVNIDSLNVRRGPATTYSIVTTLPKNFNIHIFEEKNNWLRIGPNQWVSKPLVKLRKV